MLPVYDFGSEEFDRAVAAAGRAAFHETLAAGYPVFYLDDDGLEVKELPDGRRFEISRIPGAPSGSSPRGLRSQVGHGFRLAAELPLGVASIR